MPKVTKADLEIELDRKSNLIELQSKKIMALEQELEDTRNQLGVVSRAEFNFSIIEQENQRKNYSTLNTLHEKEKSKYYAQLNLNIEQRESFECIIAELKSENETLLGQLNQKKECAIIKTEHNSRGAGRKPYENIEVIQRILSLNASGTSYQTIANTLNDEKLYTKAGKLWAKSSVRLILLKNLEKNVAESDNN